MHNNLLKSEKNIPPGGRDVGAKSHPYSESFWEKENQFVLPMEWPWIYQTHCIVDLISSHSSTHFRLHLLLFFEREKNMKLGG